VTIHGSPDQLAECEELIYTQISSEAHGDGPVAAGVLNDAPGSQPLALTSAADQVQTSAIVNIPHDSVGRVIGKKGMHIKQMQEKSGAVVHLPKEGIPGCDYREMMITGTQSQIEVCATFLRGIMTPPGSPPIQLAITALPLHHMPPYEFQHVSFDPAPTPKAYPELLNLGVLPAMGMPMAMAGAPMYAHGVPGPALMGHAGAAHVYGGPMYNAGPALYEYGNLMHHAGSPLYVPAAMMGASPPLGGSPPMLATGGIPAHVMPPLMSTLIMAISEAEASFLLGSGLLQHVQYELCMSVELSEMIGTANGSGTPCREIHFQGLPSAVQSAHDRVQSALEEITVG